MKTAWKYTCIGLYFVFVVGVYLTGPPVTVVDTVAAFVIPAIVLTVIYFFYLVLGRGVSMWVSDRRSKKDGGKDPSGE